MYKIPYKIKKENFKDLQKRLLFYKLEKKRLLLKSLFQNRSLPFSIRFFFFIKLNSMKKNTSKVRIKNRCIITGRGRSVYKLFRMSRLQIKDLAYYNLIPGLKHSSW